MKQNKPPVVWMVRPWIEDFSAFDHYDQPLGFLTIASWLRQNGCQVHYIDGLRGNGAVNSRYGNTDTHSSLLKLKKYNSFKLNKPAVFQSVPRYYKHFGMEPDQFVEVLKTLPNPDVILVTTGMTYWYQAVMKCWSILQSLYPGIPKAVGGVWAGVVPNHARCCLKDSDVFPGPADQTFYTWIGSILNIKIRAPEWNAMPIPSWDLVPDRPYVTLVTSRGCLHKCSYCAVSLLASTWKARPLNHVRDEIETLVNSYSVRHIALYDDDLGSSQNDEDNHFIEFLKMLTKIKVPVKWHLPNALAVNAITGESAELMIEAGFEQPRLSLHSMNRHMTENGLSSFAKQSFQQAANTLVGAGFTKERISTYLVAGLPGQQFLWLKKATYQLQEIGIKPCLAQYSPVPGTVSGNTRLRQLSRLFQSGDMLLTNKLLSVYAHDGWSAEEYQSFASDLKLI